MMYNKDEKSTDEFFQERGISRGDVGTKRYPVPWIRRMVAPCYRIVATFFVTLYG